jgi:hypothetical protein
MSALIFALALFAAQEAPTAPAAEAPPPEAAAPPAAAEPKATEPEEVPWPPGAPKDDYGLVAWCYGALGGYLELHDRVMPEVTRIEGAFRRPGSNLADDLKTYDDMQKASKANMKLFAKAIEAAEKASLQPISARGAAAIQKGRAAWSGAAGLPDRTVAQQWMGWALPARCTPTATALEQRAKLMGATFKSNAPETEPAPAQGAPAEDPAPSAPEATPSPESAPPTQAPVESAPTRS